MGLNDGDATWKQTYDEQIMMGMYVILDSKQKHLAFQHRFIWLFGKDDGLTMVAEFSS